MIIEDAKLRGEFNGPGLSDYSGEWDDHCECAHLLHSGFNGGNRLDVRINMARLTRGEHRNNHRSGGKPDYVELLYTIARRECWIPGVIESEIYRLRRLPKETTAAEAGYGKVATHQRAADPRKAVGVLLGSRTVPRTAGLPADEVGGQ